ncbi:MAG: hypothetical protein JKY98_03100 [Gammaproteobacteria bacterium]|nr:hypothetical protein [Gammaproteobacteria bacterium]
MSVFNRLVEFQKSLKVELVELKGTCKLTGVPISIVCGVGEKTNHYLAELLYEPEYQVNSLGCTWLWNASRFTARIVPEAVVFFTEIGRQNKKLVFYGKNYFRIPLWVRGEVRLPLNESVTKKKDYREQIRKIRKAGFDFEVTRSRAQFEDFYENMYVPQVSLSHGDSSQLTSMESLAKVFDKLELLVVKMGEQAVAGELISYEDSTPKLRAVGVRDRNPELLKKGALAACYSFALQYLEQQGFSDVNVGDSRGFINDGVLTYKRKWGQSIVEPRSIILLMKVMQNTPNARELLRNLPIICENGGALASMVFSDETELDAMRASPKFIEHHHIPGTSELVAYIMNKNMAYSKSNIVRLNPNVSKLPYKK